MGSFRQPKYRARVATGPADIEAAQRLRYQAFVDAGDLHGRDCDAFDGKCRHILIEEIRTGRLVCCFRLLPLDCGRDLPNSYAAQYYELSRLHDYPGRMVELGRFCILPGLRDPDILRLAWSEMARYVDENAVDMLFGCSSFRGIDADAYADAFAMLKERHLAPKRWLPRVKAPDVFRYARRLRSRPDTRRALLTMPPLLRSYLAMGGWVSDHAVVDRDLGTLHVFTGLEISAIPPARAAILRGVAGGGVSV